MSSHVWERILNRFSIFAFRFFSRHWPYYYVCSLSRTHDGNDRRPMKQQRKADIFGHISGAFRRMAFDWILTSMEKRFQEHFLGTVFGIP